MMNETLSDTPSHRGDRQQVSFDRAATERLTCARTCCAQAANICLQDSPGEIDQIKTLSLREWSVGITTRHAPSPSPASRSPDEQAAGICVCAVHFHARVQLIFCSRHSFMLSTSLHRLGQQSNERYERQSFWQSADTVLELSSRRGHQTAATQNITLTNAIERNKRRDQR